MAMFKEVNPSSENIARYLFSELKGPLSHDRYSLYSITILETDTSGLVYYGP
jgi:6-pyruvoyltetrahydropterin/6-carboxytetrahydropterin synthase